MPDTRRTAAHEEDGALSLDQMYRHTLDVFSTTALVSRGDRPGGVEYIRRAQGAQGVVYNIALWGPSALGLLVKHKLASLESRLNKTEWEELVRHKLDSRETRLEDVEWEEHGRHKHANPGTRLQDSDWEDHLKRLLTHPTFRVTAEIANTVVGFAPARKSKLKTLAPAPEPKVTIDISNPSDLSFEAFPAQKLPVDKRITHLRKYPYTSRDFYCPLTFVQFLAAARPLGEAHAIAAIDTEAPLDSSSPLLFHAFQIHVLSAACQGFEMREVDEHRDTGKDPYWSETIEQYRQMMRDEDVVIWLARGVAQHIAVDMGGKVGETTELVRGSLRHANALFTYLVEKPNARINTSLSTLEDVYEATMRSLAVVAGPRTDSAHVPVYRSYGVNYSLSLWASSAVVALLQTRLHRNQYTKEWKRKIDRVLHQAGLPFIQGSPMFAGVRFEGSGSLHAEEKRVVEFSLAVPGFPMPVWLNFQSDRNLFREIREPTSSSRHFWCPQDILQLLYAVDCLRGDYGDFEVGIEDPEEIGLDSPKLFHAWLIHAIVLSRQLGDRRDEFIERKRASVRHVDSKNQITKAYVQDKKPLPDLTDKEIAMYSELVKLDHWRMAIPECIRLLQSEEVVEQLARAVAQAFKGPHEEIDPELEEDVSRSIRVVPTILKYLTGTYAPAHFDWSKHARVKPNAGPSNPTHSASSLSKVASNSIESRSNPFEVVARDSLQ